MEKSNPMLARYVIPDMPSADELLPYLREIDRNLWYSNFGPLVTKFEQRLVKQLFPDKENPVSVTSVASCYHALQIGLQIFRLPAAARVLVPAVTFPACPHAIHHAGAQPVFGDIDAGTWQLTPETARRAAQKMPIHAVMPVTVYGVPVDVDAWDRFMTETGIPVIIDAAAALGSQAVPHKALIAFSLHATKPFCMGEGGILAGRDRNMIDEARSISNFGTQMRITLQDGVNGKISEYAGAIGLAQLDRWDAMKERRRAAFALYRPMLEAAKFKPVFQRGLEKAIVSAVMLRTEGSSGAAVVNALNGRGVAAHRMYLPPLYHHPYFANLTVVNSEGEPLAATAPTEDKIAFMRNSEAIHRSLFGVPFHGFMKEADMAQCIATLTEAIHSE